MSDRSFQVFVAFAVAVMVVVMSTPLTGTGLSHLAARVLQRSAAAASAVDTTITVAKK